MRTRESTQIYCRRVNRVIDHIKDHLTEPLPIAKLARLAHFSPFHFHRIFRSIVGEPLHAFIRRLRLEKAVFQMLHGLRARRGSPDPAAASVSLTNLGAKWRPTGGGVGRPTPSAEMLHAPKTTLTAIAQRCGFASSSDFSRAFKQTYGFSPRGFSRDRLLQESKIRQDLMANAWYGFGKLPDPRNPDRFRVRLVDRPAQRIAYERVIGSFDMQRLVAGFDRLMAWGQRRGLVPGAQLIGRPLDDLDITPMRKFRVDWCLVLPPGHDADGDVSLGLIPANRFAMVHCAGDLHKEDRAWKHLFHAWLPQSGYEPTGEPTMEVYRRSPVELGWETFDNDCCLPVRPLRRR